MSESEKKDRTVGRKFQVACPGTCQDATWHEVLASYDLAGEHEYMNWWTHHQVIMCGGCRAISFRQCAGDSESVYQVGENEWVSDETIRLYPAREAKAKGLGDDAKWLPGNVGLLYEEARITLLNATPVLTGIALRALVETVCKEKSAHGHNLQDRINSLVSKGVLTATDAQVLHQIRAMGNDAAHEAKPHPPDQLFLAMEVVEHLLKSVYVMPHKLGKYAQPTV